MGIRLIAILGCWSAAALWLRPFTPVPFIDDWVYGWSVENLLTTGRLETLDFSSNIAYGQTMWGALFSWPTGFSFAALRVSTWVLSLVTLVGMHQLLVDPDATEAGAAFGTASLAVFPPFVLLSFSFMTELPLLAAETWTLVFMLRAWRGQSLGALWIAAALAAVAAAIRVVGVIPALAMSAALILDSRGWGRARARFMVPLAAVLCAAALTRYNVSHIRHVADLTHVTNTPAPRLAAFHEHALTLLPAWLPLSVEFLGVGLGLALAPVALALRHQPGSLRRMATIAAGAVLVVTTGHLMGGLHYPVFASEGTWVSDELGSTLTLLPGWSPIAVPTAVTLIGTLVCWASLLRMGAWATQPGTSFLAPLWFTLGGLVLMTALLWLASDRYILAFLPPAMALVLGRGAEVSWRRGTLCLALFAAVAAVAVRDRTAAEQAVWKAVADLRRQGVAVSQIDAGYVVNGWLQFAHPEHAARDGRGQSRCRSSMATSPCPGSWRRRRSLAAKSFACIDSSARSASRAGYWSSSATDARDGWRKARCATGDP